MCLDTVTRRYTSSKFLSKDKIGWKIFICDSEKKEKLRFSHYNLPKGDIRLNKWMKASSARCYERDKRKKVIKSSDDKAYSPGFHIFYTKKDAMVYVKCFTLNASKHILKKVMYNGITAYGKEILDCNNHLIVVIAKKMKILP